MIAGAGELDERDRRDSATAMQVHDRGVQLRVHPGQGFENGSWLSRAMPKHSRIVAAMIDRQQTKIAADTTSR